MKRRRAAQPELRPIYVRPTFDRHERDAKRDWCRAAYTGERHRPKPGDFDPLWLRMGLRVQLIDARAGWVVSNPLFDQALRRNPAHDPSLPGPGWLREVYHAHRSRGLVTLPGALRTIERRLDALRAAEEPGIEPALQRAIQAGSAQRQLFSEAA